VDLPLELAVRGLCLLLPIGRTWRLRDARRPRQRAALPDGPHVYAVWHEHLLPAVALFRDRGCVTLASRSRDGELVARVLSPRDLVARGSSSRGGAAGLRRLVRAGRSGRSIVLTPDGPRGPRRSVATGVARVAALTGRPIVPVGFAATHGSRLRTWDRLRVPVPGATVYVSIGRPIAVPASFREDPSCLETIRLAMQRETARAEVIAAETREGRASGTRRACADGARRDPSPLSPLRRRARIRRALERRLRAEWTRTRPRAALRIAARMFALARRTRHALYDAGVLAAAAAPLPIVSVGGVTVGGSGKTPLASSLAGMLRARGVEVAILTRGYEDEVCLHARLRPDVGVYGHRDRWRAARRARADGAAVAVLDDGFQHRRLSRDLELLVLDRDALRRTNGWPLPAGPFREDVERAVRRTDVVVLSGRAPADAGEAAFDHCLIERLRAVAPGVTLASVRFTDGPPAPLNRAARACGGARPAVALTGIMKPNLFFERVGASLDSIRIEHALPDHGLPAADEWTRLLEEAGEEGLVMTPKDAARLAPRIPERIPAWVVPETLVWERGEAEVRARLAELDIS